jgi:hypothetical protein
MVRLTGIVEFTTTLAYGSRRGELCHGHIRATDGERFFLHPSECIDGLLPHRFDRVEFDPELSDTRGPRARNVRIVEVHDDPSDLPHGDVDIKCSECRQTFTWTERDRRFYYERRYRAPRKCATCRPLVRARLGLSTLSR